MNKRLYLFALGISLLPACNAFAGCMQDIPDTRVKLSDELRAGNLDQQGFDRLKAGTDQVQKVCDSGDERRAQAMLVNLLINMAILEDGPRSRKTNDDNNPK